MRLVLFLLLLFNGQLFATEKVLQVAVNIGPPWAYFDEDKGITGIDVEIIRHALHPLGYETEFNLLAYNRLINDFNEGKYDIASPAAFAAPGAYFTQAYLPFQDVVISLKSQKHKIASIADLGDKRIIAYQHATAVLGEEYREAVENANYIEMAEREIQVKLLIHDRTDVVIGERRLLTYITGKNHPDKELAIHPVFAVKSYGAVFKDKRLQQQFDQRLQEMQADGSYQTILQQWP